MKIDIGNGYTINIDGPRKKTLCGWLPRCPTNAEGITPECPECPFYIEKPGRAKTYTREKALEIFKKIGEECNQEPASSKSTL